MISLVARGEGQRTVPQSSSFTRVKQNGKFTAGRVVSIEGWSFLSAVAQQWSGHGRGLQVIGCSLLDRNLRRARLAQDAGGRLILKAARHSRRRRAAGKKRERQYDCDEFKPT